MKELLKIALVRLRALDPVGRGRSQLNERSAKREDVINSQIKAAMKLLHEHGHLVEDIEELTDAVYTFDERIELFRKRRLEEQGFVFLAWRHHLSTTNPLGTVRLDVHDALDRLSTLYEGVQETVSQLMPLRLSYRTHNTPPQRLRARIGLFRKVTDDGSENSTVG